MGGPLASIVILNYNYARFLPRSIESALVQDYANVEIIVVDDCSTDESRDVIAAYGRQVRPAFQPQNRGHGGAMNAGFAASSGDVVAFLDADDYLYPHALRRIVESRTPGAVQYQYRLDLVGADGTVMDAYPPPEVGWEDGDVTAALLTRGRYATTVTSGLAFERNVLQNVLPMDQDAFRQGGDGYLVTVAPLYGAVRTIDEILGAYCQHGGNHSQFATAVAKRARWRVHHDQMRHRALQDHAIRRGFKALPEIWRNDPLHLEERVASLMLEPREHPDPADSRATIAQDGIRACGALQVSRARVMLMKLWWCVVGYGPVVLARCAVRWKLQAATRPAVVRYLARAMRRATAWRRPLSFLGPARKAA
jgi:glycosyltransferase involved in cell wall biosynthesis